MTLRMKSRVDLLIENREKIGLSEKNRYIFGIPGKESHLRPWDILRSFCDKFGTNNLTSTSLRRYLVTSLQALDLSDQEIGWVSRHLGHSEHVHRQYYRTHQGVIEVGKITKLLHACAMGTLHTQTGKNINTMDMP